MVALATCFVTVIGMPQAATDLGATGVAAILLVPLADGIVAALLGYRLAALRRPDIRAAAFSALTYGAIIALAVAGLGALELPRLVEPALLVLVFYLWDAVHATEPARRRGTRWLVELGVLAVLGVAVIVLASR
jgi:hypothetical protein